MRCFVINLDRVPERWTFTQAEFRKTGLEPERFPAVDALRLADYDNIKYVPGQGSRWELVPSMVAAGESHRRVWQTVVDQGLEMAVILEDDMVLLPEFAEVLQKIEKEKPAFDLIKLDSAFRRARLSAKPLPFGRWSLHRVLSLSNSTGCYAVSNAGARQLLEWTDPFSDYIDEFIFKPRRGWRSYQIEPVVSAQLILFPEDFLADYPNARLLKTLSERTSNPGINRKPARGPASFRIRREIKRFFGKLYWRLAHMRGFRTTSPIAPERLAALQSG